MRGRPYICGENEMGAALIHVRWIPARPELRRNKALFLQGWNPTVDLDSQDSGKCRIF